MGDAEHESSRLTPAEPLAPSLTWWGQNGPKEPQVRAGFWGGLLATAPPPPRAGALGTTRAGALDRWMVAQRCFKGLGDRGPLPAPTTRDIPPSPARPRPPHSLPHIPAPGPVAPDGNSAHGHDEDDDHVVVQHRLAGRIQRHPHCLAEALPQGTGLADLRQGLLTGPPQSPGGSPQLRAGSPCPRPSSQHPPLGTRSTSQACPGTGHRAQARLP